MRSKRRNTPYGRAQHGRAADRLQCPLLLHPCANPQSALRDTRYGCTSPREPARLLVQHHEQRQPQQMALTYLSLLPCGSSKPLFKPALRQLSEDSRRVAQKHGPNTFHIKVGKQASTQRQEAFAVHAHDAQLMACWDVSPPHPPRPPPPKKWKPVIKTDIRAPR